MGKFVIFLSVVFFNLSVSFASPASDQLLKQYQQVSATEASAAAGKRAWSKQVSAKGKMRACTTCHGDDLGKSGKHQRTKKVIKAMSVSVNSERYTDEKKIKKWFKRNCKWTWGRECTAQEKADFLTYLLSE